MLQQQYTLGGCEAAEVVMMAAAASALSNSVQQLPHSIFGVTRQLDAIKMGLDGVGEEQSNQALKNNSPKLDATDGRIQFKDVSFSYVSGNRSAAKVLNGINLDLKGGEATAIIGASGSGKSTLLQLIDGTLIPNNGKVLIDGQDISKVSNESLRMQIAIVPQHPEIFDNRTIAENIKYANPNATDCEIIVAAEKAGIHDKIKQIDVDSEAPEKKLELFNGCLPAGYYKKFTGKEGVKFSGGEKQRLAIARALLQKEAKIVLMDEPTSDLDPESKADVLRGIESLHKEGKTVVIVTHDMHGIVTAMPSYIALKEGKIEEGGNPTIPGELLSNFMNQHKLSLFR
ncbi:MAG: ATP-binding cassette domain-containing protein [Alphaproteobacteria bacterium]|nr:ATP-binding cassette domain-containing protein [Alphaproteobacteria bacterium]